MDRRPRHHRLPGPSGRDRRTRAGRHDGPEIIEETRQYIRDFDRIVERTETARELYDQMLAIYPERVNPGMLWWSARTLKPLKRLLGVGMTSESSKCCVLALGDVS